jgi:hypothetical protein
MDHEAPFLAQFAEPPAMTTERDDYDPLLQRSVSFGATKDDFTTTSNTTSTNGHNDVDTDADTD